MNHRISHRDAWFFGAVLLVALSLFTGGVLAARHLHQRGYLLRHDVLFGMDADRAIRNLTEPGFNDRSNVHPFFASLFKPIGRAVIHLGFSPEMAGVILNAAAGAISILLLALYLRLRRLARPESFALILIFAASSTLVIETAVPTTYLFSLFIIVATHILLILTLRRRRRKPAAESIWILAGLLNYGVTVTNGFLAFLAYGFSRRDRLKWFRALGYGAAVLALGLILTFAVGSLANIYDERLFLFGTVGPYHPFAAFLHSLSSFLAWNVVAPIPQISISDRGVQLLTFQSWRFTAIGWLAILFWLGLLAAGINAAFRDPNRASRRLSRTLAASLVFAVLLHTVYSVTFEGNFQFSGNYQFFTVGILIPLFARISRRPVRPRLIFLLLLIAFSTYLAVSHYTLLWHSPDLVPLPKT